MTHLPLSTFRRCVARCACEHEVKGFSCLDHFVCMAFAQLTYRESLRYIEACLSVQSSNLYHLGVRSSLEWIWKTVYALDATTIGLRLSVFQWAPFHSPNGVVKVRALPDLPLPVTGPCYVTDRGYLGFEPLLRLHEVGSFFGPASAS